ncbi:MAG TPA: DUF1501 domain-containing protein [Planctomycetaceae bacterium]|jgi:hypothetical protein|nr:DUF1501 domain-containing protein [Planctomycetaceae bacterium]
MLSRRDCLRMAAAGVSFTSVSGWFGSFAAQTQKHPARKRSCILLWMPGGPSQLDTFDPKPGHANGGPFKAIQTAAPGVSISEHLPGLAKQMGHAAVIRSMSTKEGDHNRATSLMQTGYLPQGPIRYPSFGSLFSKELVDPHSEMPGFVSIAPSAFFRTGPGFLGPQYAPMVVGGEPVVPRKPEAETPAETSPDDFGPPLRVANLGRPSGVTSRQAEARLDILKHLDQQFSASRPSPPIASHLSAYERALLLMKARGGEAFDLDEEPQNLRVKYGRNQFGQGCLLARRLIERGVPFVEVSLANNGNALGWDTHVENFKAVQSLSETLDAGCSTLIADLAERGLLASTLIVWMGEFGRTPKINANNGRDHFPSAWSTVLMGGGIRGGQAIGKTDPDGMRVAERPVAVGDFLATICAGLGIDPTKQNVSNIGRPIRIIDPKSSPIREALA